MAQFGPQPVAGHPLNLGERRMVVEPYSGSQCRQSQDETGQNRDGPEEIVTQCHGGSTIGLGDQWLSWEEKPVERPLGFGFCSNLRRPRSLGQSGKGLGVEGSFSLLNALVQ